MRDFNAVFDELTADAKALCNLFGRATFEYQLAERGERYERGSAYGIGRLFIRVVVVAGNDSAACAFGRIDVAARYPDLSRF